MTPRICFVTPGVLPMLRQAAGTVYGGSELRAWRFARGLADLGFDVGITAADAGPLPLDALGPVHVHNAIANDGWLSRIGGRLRRRRNGDEALWSIAGADIYVAFGAAEYNADLADWCKANDRPLLLLAGSDADFSADYRPGNRARNLWGSHCDRCYDSVIKATSIVVQTVTQQRLLKERFSRDAVVIVNPVPIEDETKESSSRRNILWIGKAVPNKRPDLALAIARACPDIFFRMIANKVDEQGFQKLLVESPGNVEVIDSVRPSELRDEFSAAIALLSTSDIEGFPNTFLDAGSFGVPVLSLRIDPDGILNREGGGMMADGNLSVLIGAVRQYAENPEMAVAAGSRLRDYVRRRHEMSGRVSELAKEIRRVIVAHKVSTHSTRS